MKRFCILLFMIPSLVPADVRAQKGKPIDVRASNETKALYRNLNKLSKNHTLFGHQHATEYGHGWSNDPLQVVIRQ